MTDHLESKSTNGSIYKVIIQKDGSTYAIFGFATAAAALPERDMFAECLEEAKEICFLAWGVPVDQWSDIEDPESIKFLRLIKAEGL